MVEEMVKISSSKSNLLIFIVSFGNNSGDSTGYGRKIWQVK